ncbi:hypothetical protein DPMN_075983 [Dreissena polymorpha]|uniref:Uncharacterized protein n=1 Tax=Dreissena polymorpha TaxID=45954 RepID=A0A9D3YLH2_DREPO|nr:hypothetical protein DPMN_075983 [Dreissena polymorpha]
MPGRGKGTGRKRRQPSPTTRAGAKRGRQDDDEIQGESLILVDRPERLSDTWVLGDSSVRWAGGTVPREGSAIRQRMGGGV